MRKPSPKAAAPGRGPSTANVQGKGTRISRSGPRPKTSESEQLVACLGLRVRNLRREIGYTLEELAERSTVSRAMLSKVERSEKSPTLSIIVRIAKGLNVTLSSLLGSHPDAGELFIVRSGDRVTYRDPDSGFEREVLSPPHPDNAIEILLHRLPAGKSTGALPAYAAPTDKYVIVHEGRLTVHTGDGDHMLSQGDTLFFEVKEPYSFTNSGDIPVSYYVVIRRRG